MPMKSDAMSAFLHVRILTATNKNKLKNGDLLFFIRDVNVGAKLDLFEGTSSSRNTWTDWKCQLNITENITEILWLQEEESERDSRFWWCHLRVWMFFLALLLVLFLKNKHVHSLAVHYSEHINSNTNVPAETLEKMRPGTARIWRWWCTSGCSHSATVSSCRWRPSSRRPADIAASWPPPGALDSHPPEF